MTDDRLTPPEHQPPLSGPPVSLVDRLGIPPIAFGFFCLAAIFVLYQVGGAVITFLVLGGADVHQQIVPAVRWLTLGGQVGLILVPTLVLGRLLSPRWSAVFPFRLPSVRETVLVIIGLLSLQRMFEVYIFLQRQIPLPPLIEQILAPLRKMMEDLMRMLLQADSGGELLFVLVVVAVAPGIIEELMFRGLIQSSFERGMSPVWAAAVSGVVFGLYHLNPFDLVPLAGLGIFLGFVRSRSATLILPILIHFTNNGLAVLAHQFHVDEDAMFTPMGPAAPTVPILLFQTVVFSVLFVWSMLSYIRATERVTTPPAGSPS